MLEVVKEMLTSKKFIMSISTSLVAAVARIGLELSPEDVSLIIGPLVGYVISQGWADSGKEAEKEKSKNTLIDN